jgi:hypothetical protein
MPVYSAPKSLFHSWMPGWYSIDGHVGPGKANRPEDVLLVQFGLRQMGANPPSGQTITPALKQQLASVPVTGTCDASTVSAIKAFQNWRKTKFPSISVDGVVSPAIDNPSYGAGTMYTIVDFCMAMKRGSVSNWPAVYLDASCPAPLKPILRKALYGE